ncbi:DNA cytosine methyltransferase [Pseudomonas aeruginosa]
MTTIITAKIGTAKGGISRIWLEGQKLIHAGVRVGAKYVQKQGGNSQRLELVPTESSDESRGFKVSKRERNGVVYPLLEIRTDLIAAMFKGCEKVRVAIRAGRIVVSALHVDLKIRERVERLKRKLAAKEKLAIGSIFHGGGVMDSAMHRGMLAVGVASFVMFAVEVEPIYLDSSLRNNRELFTEDSYVINSDIRDLDLLGGVPQIDCLHLGLPCTGASRSGKAKNKIEFAEEHQDVGALFHDFLNVVAAGNPALITMEQVVDFSSAAGMAVIRSVLRKQGYELYETVLNGADFGAIEARDRLVLVAVTKGLDFGLPFMFPSSHPQVAARGARTLGDVLEDIPLDSPMWKTYDYLAEKEVRDLADGKGFKRALVTGSVSTIGTQGKGYAKARSTEVQLIHPTNPKLSRLLTPVEHAGVKGIPVCVIEGLSPTRAHEVLGQSVCYAKFEALGYAVGSFLQGLALPSEYLVPPVVADGHDGITDYCGQVCGGGECGAGAVCQYGIDPETRMPAPAVPVQLDFLEVA